MILTVNVSVETVCAVMSDGIKHGGNVTDPLECSLGSLAALGAVWVGCGAGGLGWGCAGSSGYPSLAFLLPWSCLGLAAHPCCLSCCRLCCPPSTTGSSAGSGCGGSVTCAGRAFSAASPSLECPLPASREYLPFPALALVPAVSLCEGHRVRRVCKG